MKLIFNNQ